LTLPRKKKHQHQQEEGCEVWVGCTKRRKEKE